MMNIQTVDVRVCQKLVRSAPNTANMSLLRVNVSTSLNWSYNTNIFPFGAIPNIHDSTRLTFCSTGNPLSNPLILALYISVLLLAISSVFCLVNGFYKKEIQHSDMTSRTKASKLTSTLTSSTTTESTSSDYSDDSDSSESSEDEPPPKKNSVTVENETPLSAPPTKISTEGASFQDKNIWPIAIGLFAEKNKYMEAHEKSHKIHDAIPPVSSVSSVL